MALVYHIGGGLKRGWLDLRGREEVTRPLRQSIVLSFGLADGCLLRIYNSQKKSLGGYTLPDPPRVSRLFCTVRCRSELITFTPGPMPEACGYRGQAIINPCANVRPRGQHSLSFMRQHFQRRRIRFYSQRVVRNQPDFPQRRLLEIAIRRFPHCVLPHRQGALAGERLGDRPCTASAKLIEFRRRQSDHNLRL